MKQNSKIQKLPNKTFILNFEIKKEEVEKEHQCILKQLQSEFESKGFRKGKAPIDVVEAQTSPEKIFEEVASHIISHYYADCIKANDLKPIIQPQVKFKNEHVDFDHDWQIEITSCELPEIEIKEKYLDEVKKINADKTITDENKRMDDIVKTLIKNTKLDLPQILVESDTEIHLSRLINDVNQTGSTVEKVTF